MVFDVVKPNGLEAGKWHSEEVLEEFFCRQIPKGRARDIATALKLEDGDHLVKDSEKRRRQIERGANRAARAIVGLFLQHGILQMKQPNKEKPWEHWFRLPKPYGQKGGAS